VGGGGFWSVRAQFKGELVTNVLGWGQNSRICGKGRRSACDYLRATLTFREEKKTMPESFSIGGKSGEGKESDNQNFGVIPSTPPRKRSLID